MIVGATPIQQRRDRPARGIFHSAFSCSIATASTARGRGRKRKTRQRETTKHIHQTAPATIDDDCRPSSTDSFFSTRPTYVPMDAMESSVFLRIPSEPSRTSTTTWKQNKTCAYEVSAAVRRFILSCKSFGASMPYKTKRSIRQSRPCRVDQLKRYALVSETNEQTQTNTMQR